LIKSRITKKRRGTNRLEVSNSIVTVIFIKLQKKYGVKLFENHKFGSFLFS